MTKTKEIVSTIKSILPKRRPIEHHEAFIDKYETKILLFNAIDRGIIGYDYLDRFSDYIKDVTKTENVVLTSSGTSALEIALRVIGIKPQDNVIVPSATFVATANAVSHVGAVPIFIDSAPTISPSTLRYFLEETPKKIAAIIVVHLFGLPADMLKLCKIAKEHNIKIIEDAAQALGSSINDKACGTFGDVGTFSFNNNKIVTTGGGGALITDNKDLADKALRLITTSKVPHKWLIEHDNISWNYRMGNINAALGCAQFQDFARTLASKRALAMRYRMHLEPLVKFVESTVKSEPNYWLNTILVDNRDEVLGALHSESIRARAMFTPLHKLVIYSNHHRSHEVMCESEDLHARGICLPSGTGL